MATIEEELKLVAQKYPDFAPRVRRSIEQGDMDGGHFTTCFYGQVCHGDFDASYRLSHAMRTAFGLDSTIDMTPIEDLIEHVQSGSIQQTDSRLARLYDALAPYLPAGEETAAESE